eukprot:UN30118
MLEFQKQKAGAEGLKSHIIGNTTVESYHLDVKDKWSKVVELAKECTVIFNNVDVGEYYDYAVLTLAKTLGIPCCMGSSYSYSCIIEGFNGDKEGTSYR